MVQLDIMWNVVGEIFAKCELLAPQARTLPHTQFVFFGVLIAGCTCMSCAMVHIL